jgi:hypothetical protein
MKLAANMKFFEIRENLFINLATIISADFTIKARTDKPTTLSQKSEMDESGERITGSVVTADGKKHTVSGDMARQLQKVIIDHKV